MRDMRVWFTPKTVDTFNPGGIKLECECQYGRRRMSIICLQKTTTQTIAMPTK